MGNFISEYWPWIVAAVVALLIVLLIIVRKKAGKGFRPYRKQMKFDIHPRTGDKPEEKEEAKKVVALYHFEGDMKASSRFELSSFVDEVVHNKDHVREVVLQVESPGGAVSQYGHCMSEVERIRNAEIPLTVCVDTVAASGGYLMSLPANKILAAPYALVGSIGVMSFVPNIRKLLERMDIHPRTFTAGDFKRTVTLTDDASEEDVAHYKSKLENIHKAFTDSVAKYREGIDTKSVCNGDYWLAKDALEKDLKLVDEIMSSSDYLMEINKAYPIVSIEKKKKPLDKIKKAFSSQISSMFGNSLY